MGPSHVSQPIRIEAGHFLPFFCVRTIWQRTVGRQVKYNSLLVPITLNILLIFCRTSRNLFMYDSGLYDLERILIFGWEKLNSGVVT